MLKRDINIIIWLTLFFILSCSQHKDKEEYLLNQLGNKDYKLLSEKISKQVIDTIQSWIKANLNDVRDIIYNGYVWDVGEVWGSCLS